MRIWIVNYYTGTPENQTHPRYEQFARRFMDAGHEVITINSSLTSNTQEEQTSSGKKIIERTYGDYQFIHINAPAYQGNGLKRMYSIWKFAEIIKKVANQYPRPDVILHNIHTPFDYSIVKIAKKVGAKYIAEAWDLWPESFARFGLIKESNPFMKYAYRIERRLYEQADQVVFTFEGGMDYLRSKGWTTDTYGSINSDKVHYINSGVDLEKFDVDKNKHPRLDADMNDPNTYKIIYLGSIRLVNHVKQLIDAAVLLKDNPKYRFFIYGDGVERPELEQYVRDNNITNVVFKEKQIPFEEVAWVVCQSTVNVMNYQKNFGIHGSSSGKMFQYFAAGKPILCNIKLNYSEISRHNLGIDRELNTPEQYAAAIRELAEQPRASYDAMCERVREVAKKFDYKVLAARELEIIESLMD